MYSKAPQRFKVFLTSFVSIGVLILGSMLHTLSSERSITYAQGNEPTATSMPTSAIDNSTLLSLPNISSLGSCEPGSNTNPGTPTLISVPETLPNLCTVGNDNQYYQFTAKKGKVYEISTVADATNVDTHLYLYRETVSQDLQNYIQQNDDESSTSLNSKLTYQAPDNKTYIVRVQNKSIVSDTYTLAIKFVEPIPPAATNTPGATSTPEARIAFDAYEDNYNFDTAYVIAADPGPPETFYDLNFVPVSGNGPDNDFFKLWVKAGGTYTCATSDLSPYNDTNMIIYDQNRSGLAGNDDEAVGVLSSRVTYYATYTGWLYLLVGPNVEVNYNVSDQYEYKLNCFSSFAPPPPAPQPTSSSSSSSTQAQTAPMPSTTPPATSGVATVMPLSQQIVSVDEVAPQITITSLETASTPVAPAIGSFTVAIHQGSADATDNSSAIEGVGNMPVALYSADGDLLAFGYTNNQGDLTVDIVSAGSEVTVVIPYLGLREVVSYPAFTFLEITLPSLEINAEDSQ